MRARIYYGRDRTRRFYRLEHDRSRARARDRHDSPLFGTNFRIFGRNEPCRPHEEIFIVIRVACMRARRRLANYSATEETSFRCSYMRTTVDSTRNNREILRSQEEGIIEDKTRAALKLFFDGHSSNDDAHLIDEID